MGQISDSYHKANTAESERNISVYEGISRIINGSSTLDIMMDQNAAFRELMITNSSFKNMIEDQKEMRIYLQAHPDKKKAIDDLNKSLQKDNASKSKRISKNQIDGLNKFKQLTEKQLNNKKNKPTNIKSRAEIEAAYRKMESILDKEGEQMEHIKAKNIDRVKNSMTTDGASAGYLVPETLHDKVISAMFDNSTVMALAEIIPVEGKKIRVPIDTGDSESTAGWLAEETSFDEFSPVVTYVDLIPAKLGTLTKVSDELQFDSGFNVEEYIASSAGAHLSSIAEQEFINGTTSGQPSGILGAATLALTSSVTASFGSADLINLYGSVKQKYRKKASWIVSDAALKTMLTLQDAVGNFIFKPAADTESPDMLLGKPVYVSEAMADPATGAEPIIFGDISYYKIGLKDLKVAALPETFATNGQVGYFTTAYVDGELAIAEAVSKMVCL